MSEMIDRVAKAISDAGMAWLAENDPKRMTMTWADIPDEVLAKAAIEAMREPTVAMLEMAERRVCVGPRTAKEIIQAAIDGALK